MKQCILASIMILILASPCFAVDMRLAIEEADTYLRNGQYLEAIGAYQGILDLSHEPEVKARSLLRIGDIYAYFLNNNDRALQQYDRVIKDYGMSVNAANAYFNSAMILYEKNRFREAGDRFKIYLRKYPSGERRDTAEFMVELCSRPPPVTKEKRAEYTMPIDEEIKVLIVSNAPRIVVNSSSAFDVKESEGKEPFLRVESVTVDFEQGRIRMSGAAIPQGDRVVVIPSGRDMLRVNGVSYRGKLVIKKSVAGGLDVINILPLQAYLYGVVPKEISPQWPVEALKAQAIAARSYALYQRIKNRDRDYDVLATTSSQVYGGAGAENERSNRAIDDTRGMVLLYDGQLILSYFHANSGGMTEDAERVWTAEVPYLKAVRDDYSVRAPHTSWQLTLNLNEIRNILAKKGLGVDLIDDIVPLDISPSGRVTKIQISHRGRNVVLSGNDFRMKIGPTMMKSTLFTIHNDGGKIRFEGKGYGHGVGMSQWGAYVMAREGKSCEEILKHYYPGVEIKAF